MKEWMGKVAAIKHTNHIRNKDIADKLSVTEEYVSMLLNGKKTPPNAEERIFAAIDEIISERQQFKKQA